MHLHLLPLTLLTAGERMSLVTVCFWQSHQELGSVFPCPDQERSTVPGNYKCSFLCKLEVVDVLLVASKIFRI